MSGVRKTASVTSAARIREDSNILRNIKKREVVSAMKGNTKSLSLGGLDRAASKKPVKTSFTLRSIFLSINIINQSIFSINGNNNK